MGEKTVGVVGGGILGVAIAREVVRRRPGTEVVVLEKEDHLAAHQTGHNSGVVHAGIYYRPGTLKAELCTRGRLLLREFCAEHAIAYDECGKLVVAVDEAEMGRFDALERTATANGVPGLRRLTSAEITEVEPHAAGLAALHSPATAITDYVAITRAIADEVVAAGGEVRLSSPVVGIRREGGRVAVDVAGGGAPVVVDHLVVAAGLQSDRVAALVGAGPSPAILPFRGEYLAVSRAKQDLVRGMVYPVPDPRYPFLGVHFTRRVGGELEVGPNAVLATRREGYRRRDVSAADLRDVLTYPGFWRLARAHWRTGIDEVIGSASTRAFMRKASRYVPAIDAGDVVRAGSGVRAQAVDRDGSLVDDFRITQADGVTLVRNAPSPAATSSLAIAAHVVDETWG
ncbi:hydroxyglutarate oxidase [Nocardioides sp. Root122]|uniref:L-2-hydroxyglutarate oxidase n=1 Tax=Nocardioides TaxID=1839 RepID=UPI0007027C0C|nr:MULTISPECIES: L-2-hydroxyglutarate oxidase [Nocardioides]KQV64938.1 hydroxyglutarate oxidase [Nocardioides sp. Root122]MCK9823509.1 L-2-hydroxyglutarate oxidase [Nocardioides cavernae]